MEQNSAADFYINEVSPLLPGEVLDFHTHIWKSENWKSKPWETENDGGKYMVTTENYPPETLLADGRNSFPDKRYEAVIFGYPTPVVDLAKDSRYVADAAKKYDKFFPLVLAGKSFNLTREQIHSQLSSGGFWGYKVFLNWLGNDYADIGIEDMLGEAEMSLANEYRLIVMLHVPRAGRLADPEIQKGVVTLAKEYPNAQIVLAHCGRCYLPSEMKRAIGSLKQLDNVSMDTSMVMDSLTLQIAMEAIGPERLLYGSDFPVAAMKGRRVRVMDHWVDVVLDEYPESAYRAMSDDIRATYMAVEIAVAVCEAAAQVGITDNQRISIFHANGMKLLNRVKREELAR